MQTWHRSGSDGQTKYPKIEKDNGQQETESLVGEDENLNGKEITRKRIYREMFPAKRYFMYKTGSFRVGSFHFRNFFLYHILHNQIGKKIV